MSDLLTSTPATVGGSTAQAAPRTGTWTAYRTLLRWQLAQIGPLLPVIVLVQALMGAGLIVGFAFLIPDIDQSTALRLSTGAPTLLLLTVGLIVVPGALAQARADGRFAYLRTLPVPRPLHLLADLTVWTAVALPGIAVALVLAWLRFDLPFAFDWPVLAAGALLVTLTAATVGYAIAVALPPMLAQLTTQALVFLLLLFSPVSFPASQLPGWFQAVHDILPIRPAADLVRAGLASGTYAPAGRDLLVLLLWCALGTTVSVRALVRRV